MAVFFTHVLNRSGFAKDEEGQDLATLEDGRRLAIKSARELLADEMEAGRYQVDLKLYIHDETGARLATLPVSARVTGLDN